MEQDKPVLKDLKFTPGPWQHENSGAGNQILMKLADSATNMGEYKLKADHWVPMIIAPWCQFPNKEYCEMQEANFKLIAKAPEMYEALKQAKEWLESIEFADVEFDTPRRKVLDTINKLGI